MLKRSLQDESILNVFSSKNNEYFRATYEKKKEEKYRFKMRVDHLFYPAYRINLQEIDGRLMK